MMNSANTFARHTIFSRHTFRAQDRYFLVCAALVFVVCTTATIIDCVHMSAVDGMSMAGGWTMSMMWMLMPDQTWFEAAVSFARMWVVMMVAMMMPVLFTMLRRYRQSIGDIPRLNLLTLMISIGYFFTWILVGTVVFPMGIWVADVAMQNSTIARNAPTITGLIVTFAGVLQFTRWKAQQLACCRNTPEQHIPIKRNISSSLRYGFRIGLRCNYCCTGLTLVLLVVGVMDPVAMTLVAIAIAAERLATAGRQVAKLIGIILIGIGLYMLIQALGFKQI